MTVSCWKHLYSVMSLAHVQCFSLGGVAGGRGAEEPHSMDTCHDHVQFDSRVENQLGKRRVAHLVCASGWSERRAAGGLSSTSQRDGLAA